MKKNGFTLAEVLVTLSIVGIASALLTPIIGNSIPDKNKTTILNLYQTIAANTESMLSNSSIYYGNEEKYDAATKKLIRDCSGGIDCQQQPLIDPYDNSDYKGAKKYARLLANSLGATNISSTPSGNDDTTVFETTGGILWSIESKDKGESKITIDVNGEKGKNCSYNKTSCTKPDQFKFKVNYTGEVVAADALTDAYLKNSLKLNDKKNDLLKASESTFDYDSLTLRTIDMSDN